MATVLIADDDGEVRGFLRGVLRAEGHEVLEARHGGEALRLVQFFEPDVLLLDIVMPEMNGLETMKAIRETKASFPIVAMADHGIMSRSWSAGVARMFGADAILEKPFTETEVREVLARTLPAGA